MSDMEPEVKDANANANEEKEKEKESENKIENWDDIELNPQILRGIYAYGFEKPSDIQKKSIPVIISGKDVIAQAQSGMGKTAAFSISTLQRIDVTKNETQAFMLAPTHELVKQTCNVITALGASIPQLRIKTMIGGTSIQEDKQNIDEHVPHVIVGSAGRLYDMLRRRYLSAESVKLLVLDEADEMLSQGFSQQIYNIFQYLNSDIIQVVLFSATLPDEILEITSKFMRNPVRIVMEAEKLNLECIKQYYVALHNDPMKYDTLKDLFSAISVSQCIIYCNSINRVKDLHDAMLKDGFSVGAIYGSMDKTEREKEFSQFRSGNYRVLISSNVTARGIDIQHVSVVINFDIPKCPHTYLHRIGRSGRWGRKGMAINFVTSRDTYIMRNIENHYKITMEELPANFEEHTRGKM
jgi:translation initiation factor 4A